MKRISRRRFLSNFPVKSHISVEISRHAPMLREQFMPVNRPQPGFLPLAAAVFATLLLSLPTPAEETDGIEFFEKKIRPLLAERCYECHSEAKKIKGGLHLDLAGGWLAGGDSGPAVMAGSPEESLLIKAVRYTDRDLKMPPKKKLPPAEVALLEEWVKRGAPAPAANVASARPKQVGLSLEEGRKFWAFIPPKPVAPPAVKDASWPQRDLDRFILAKIEERGLKPAAPADRAALIRRAYFDLIGLPPTPEQIDEFVHDTRPDAFARVVDSLLASPHFGERWGRHWLDVARFAESSGGGRTLLFKDAWRFRDYVIDSFNQDVSFDRFIREQLAGDLLPHATPEQRRRQLIATAFLALGPTNYEEQDKGALRMDIVDEQLDTMGKAFLGMTIGCARCHDHKFDPVPTKDYYALAGILRSTRTLFNYTDNVARWVDVPLPMAGEAELMLQAHEARLAELREKLDALKATAKQALAGVASGTDMMKGMALSPDLLPGIVLDDAQARVVGDWRQSQFSKSYIGDGYLGDRDEGKGAKTLTFTPPIPRSGRYEVRLAYSPLSNRATNTPVTIFHADGEHTIAVDQRETPPISGRFVSLGQFRFEKDGEGYVLVSNEGTTGHVVVDALQFIPVEELGGTAAAGARSAGLEDDQVRKAAAEVRQLETELKKLAAAGPRREVAMSVGEEKDIGDTQIRIRGNVRNLGPAAPRGFLQVAMTGLTPQFSAKESGRRELADWIASPENPLTARVFANRAWTWLLGSGLVRTVDNFGTTGELPSHPELLDHLARRFIAEAWSVKKLVREIMLSRTYQLAAAARPSEADPDNRLFSHASRRRLDAEQIRDTILWVSGELKLGVGGPNIAGAGAIDANTTAAQNTEYTYVFNDTRRSVYTPAFRNRRLEIFEVFDFGDINATLGKRNVSTVAPQALYLMNHPFVIEQAKSAAQRALALPGLDDAARIERAYRMALGRPPTAKERDLALQFVAVEASAGTNESQRLEAWAQFYQSLFACVDFRYVN
jgi:hypothetical protein